jgi:hypothetical protein
MPPYLLSKNDRMRGVVAMRQGGWGRIQVAINRAFIASHGRPLTTMALVGWAHPRVREVGRHHRYSVRRAVSRMATRVGRRNPGGIVWKLKNDPR